MGYQVYFDLVVNIEPFGMVVHLLDVNGSPAHKTKGIDKVFENKFLVQLAVGDAPALEYCEFLFYLFFGKFARRHCILLANPIFNSHREKTGV